MWIIILIIIWLWLSWLTNWVVLESIASFTTTQDNSFDLIRLIILWSLKVILVYMYCLSATSILISQPTWALLNTTWSTIRLYIISIHYLTQLWWFCWYFAIGIRRLIESILNIYHFLIFINLLYFILSLTENLLSVLLQLMPAVVKWFHTELLSSIRFRQLTRPWNKLVALFFIVLWEQLLIGSWAGSLLEEITFHLVNLILGVL